MKGPPPTALPTGTGRELSIKRKGEGSNMNLMTGNERRKRREDTEH